MLFSARRWIVHRKSFIGSCKERQLVLKVLGVCLLVFLSYIQITPFFSAKTNTQSYTVPTLDGTCQDISFSADGNPFPLCPGGRRQGGNCTWWAWEQWHLLGYDLPLNWGNAADWIVDAQHTGLSIGESPRVGSIAVFPHADGFWALAPEGHVAFVTAVSDDGLSFDVTYQNYGDPTLMYTGTGLNISIINQSSFQNGMLRFIYFPRQIDVQRFANLPGITSTNPAMAVAQANQQLSYGYGSTLVAGTTFTNDRVAFGLSSPSPDQQFNGNFAGNGLSDLLIYNRQQGNLSILKLNEEQAVLPPSPKGPKPIPPSKGARPIRPLKASRPVPPSKGPGKSFADTSPSSSQPVDLGDAITPQGKWGSSLQVYVGDFSGMGESDILLYDHSAGTIQLLNLNPDLTIKKHATIAGIGSGWEIYPGRFDGQRMSLFMYKRFAELAQSSSPPHSPGSSGGTRKQPTKTPSPTPKSTATPTPIPTPTPRTVPSPCVMPMTKATPSPCETPSPCAIKTEKEASIICATPTVTETPSPCAMKTEEATPSPCATPTVTETPSPCATETEKGTPSPCETPTVVETPSPCATETEKGTPSPCETPTVTEMPSPCATETEKGTPSPCETPTATATPSPSTAPTGTATPSPSPTTTPTLIPVTPSPTRPVWHKRRHSDAISFDFKDAVSTATPTSGSGDLSGVALQEWEKQGRTANILLLDFDQNFNVRNRQQYTLWHSNWEAYVCPVVDGHQNGIFLYDRLVGEGRLMDFDSNLLVNDYQEIHNLQGNWMVYCDDFANTGSGQILLYDPSNGNVQILSFDGHLALSGQKSYSHLGTNQVLYVGHFGMPTLSIMLYDPQNAQSTFVGFDQSLDIVHQYLTKSWDQSQQILVGAFLDRSRCVQSGDCSRGDDILVLDRKTGQVKQYIFTFGRQFQVYDNRAQSFIRQGIDTSEHIDSVDTTTFKLVTTLSTPIRDEEVY